MKILHWTENFLPITGGLPRFCYDLAHEQTRAGEHVMVMTNTLVGRTQHEEVSEGIEIRRVPFRPAVAQNDPGLIRQSARDAVAVKQSFQPDIIHVHASGMLPWLHVLTLNAWPAAKVVVTLHTPFAHQQLPVSVADRLLQSAHRVTAVSAATLHEWINRFPGLHEKSESILNGLTPPAQSPSALNFGAPTLLCLGRLHSSKGFDVALHALATLTERWPTARLVIAGDGPDRAELETLSAQLGLTDRVMFSGWISADQAITAINNATLVLMPSRWAEPFGLVAAEAAFMGRPLIASQVGGLPEFVVDGETGRLVPPDDPHALAIAIDDLLRNPGEARRVGAAARERAHRHLSMERCAADYATLYRRVIC